MKAKIAHPSTFNLTTKLVLGLLALALLAIGPAQAQTYNVIYNFTGGHDGAYPAAGLTLDQAGHLYGTTYLGGGYKGYCYPTGCGAVFELLNRGQGWTLKPLYGFAGGSDGALLESRVVFGPDGSLYGATATGGIGQCTVNSMTGCGMVFNLKPPPTAPISVLSPWNKAVVYAFQGVGDGGVPGFGDLTFDQAGNLYGTAEVGGANDFGAVYKLTPSGNGWTETVLYSFTNGADGAIPLSNVVLDQAGNLYGTAQEGTYGYGIVFQLVPSQPEWILNILHSFQNSGDGLYPTGLAFDHSGNLYGITAGTDPQDGATIYELTQSGGHWTFSTLYQFNGTSEWQGTGPAMDGNGNLYGTLYYPGAHGYGSVFELKHSNGSWTYLDLHDFNGGTSDGCNPFGNVTIDTKGDLYGTANGCGANGYGIVWEITP